MTFAEFTITTDPNDKDCHDISAIDGYNIGSCLFDIFGPLFEPYGSSGPLQAGDYEAGAGLILA